LFKTEIEDARNCLISLLFLGLLSSLQFLLTEYKNPYRSEASLHLNVLKHSLKQYTYKTIIDKHKPYKIYKYTKLKLLRTNAVIWFNKICRDRQLQTRYINIKIKGRKSKTL